MNITLNGLLAAFLAWAGVNPSIDAGPSCSTGSLMTSSNPTSSQFRLKTSPHIAVPEKIQFPPALPDILCDIDAIDKINAKSSQVSPSILGTATGLVEIITPCVGYRQRFQFGSIFYHSDATEAFSVHSDIAAHYLQIGEQESSLGFPTTDQTKCADGIGRFNHFQFGSIFWKPNLGAHALWGPLHDEWAAEGFETNSDLGYPILDMFPTYNELIFDMNDQDWMVSFENGVLYLKLGESVRESVPAPAFGSLNQPEVQLQLIKQIDAQLDGDGIVDYIKEFQTTDYQTDGWGFHNRRYIVTAYIDFYLPDILFFPT